MKQIISYGLNVILLICVIWAANRCYKEKVGRETEKEIFTQEMTDAQKEIDYAWANFDSCVAAKVQIDTIYDTTYKYLGYRYIHKDLTLEDSLEIHNIFAVSTSGETIELERDSVSDTFITKDFDLPWEVVFTGQFHELRFPSYNLYEERIVERYLMNNPPPPIEPKIIKEHKSALFAHAEFGNNLEGGFDWNSVGGGLTWIHKRGAMIGLEYEWLNLPNPYYHEDLYEQMLKIRVGYRLTK